MDRTLLALVAALLFPAAARAQDPGCVHDDALSRAALELASHEGPLDGGTLVRIAREAGSDAPSFHATALSTGDDTRRREWLAGLAPGAEGSLACGEAQRGETTILVAAPRLGHLVAISEAPYRVRASLEVELVDPVLYVLDATGETRAYEVLSSPAEVDLGDDIELPARLQLVATGAHGPRPVAVLELGAPVSAAALAPDLTSRERLTALASTDDPSPLRVSHLLDRLAREHAEAVCAEGVVGHELEPGLEPEARIRRSGVSARHVGEVVARGADEIAAWTALAASPSHIFALRDRRFTDAGIGLATDASGRACLVVLLAAWPRYVGIRTSAD